MCARLAKWYGDRLEIKNKVAVVHPHSGVRIPYLALSIRVKTLRAKYGQKQTLKNRLKADIHNYDKKIDSVLRRIENTLSKQTVELIRKSHSEMISESISKATQLKHLEVLLNLSRFLKKECVMLPQTTFRGS